MTTILTPDFIQIPSPVLKNENLQPGDKFLFGYIYWLTKLKLETCTASNETLGEMVGVGVSSIKNSLARLEEQGFISRKYEGDPHSSKSNRTVDCLVSYCTQMSTVVYSDEYGGVLKNGPNIENKKENLSSAQKSKSLLALVNEITGREFRVLPERGVKKTLDSFSLEEITAALRALAADDWHREKLKEFKIDYLIRSTTIDKFLAIAKTKPQSSHADLEAEHMAEMARIDEFNKNRESFLD